MMNPDTAGEPENAGQQRTARARARGCFDCCFDFFPFLENRYGTRVD